MSGGQVCRHPGLHQRASPWRCRWYACSISADSRARGLFCSNCGARGAALFWMPCGGGMACWGARACGDGAE